MAVRCHDLSIARPGDEKGIAPLRGLFTSRQQWNRVASVLVTKVFGGVADSEDVT